VRKAAANWILHSFAEVRRLLLLFCPGIREPRAVSVLHCHSERGLTSQPSHGRAPSQSTCFSCFADHPNPETRMRTRSLLSSIWYNPCVEFVVYM